MGCFYSKTVRCSRCNRSVSVDELRFNNKICQECVLQSQQIGEYKRRLAALRDENTADTALIAGASILIRPTQTRQVSSLPRYTIKSKVTSKTRGKRPSHRPTHPKPLYGEFKCSSCKHFWTSRRVWRGMYQKCQKCGKQTYPHIQRELLKSDMSNTDKPHLEHLCEKCTRIGSYCGNIKK